MNDAPDSPDDIERQSRRGRWKDALTRTKSRFKKERADEQQQEEVVTLDDVNDFLAAGRKPAATVTVSPGTASDDRLPFQSGSSLQSLPRPSISNTASIRQPSPRRVIGPKLDVSQSQRWPNGRQIDPETRSRSDDHLSPDFATQHNYNHSQHSNSALAKKRSKPRGLRVAFARSPPVIIGIGGDDAEAPPCEIARAREHSRTLSPNVHRPQSRQSNSSLSPSPVRRKPVPSPSPPARSPEPDDDTLQPKPFRRVQTGLANQQERSPDMTKKLANELNLALGLEDRGASKAAPRAPINEQMKGSPPAYNERQPSSILTRGDPVSGHQSGTTSPQNAHHPDLQQSRQTSTKRPPPKVPNFYAQLNQQSHGPSPGIDKETFVQQLQEVVVRPRPRPQNQFHDHVQSNPTDATQNMQRQARVTQETPPEGWI